MGMLMLRLFPRESQLSANKSNSSMRTDAIRRASLLASSERRFCAMEIRALRKVRMPGQRVGAAFLAPSSATTKTGVLKKRGVADAKLLAQEV
jgi:hypothetical protein